MKRRRGRPRRFGARKPSGDLRRLPAETPRQIAARMPHRRGLGDRAVDQRAETELGRLVLRGTLTADQGLAGETYLALWRGYVMSLAGPAELANAGGHGFTCDGCETAELRKYCRCSFRRRIYDEARRALVGAGSLVYVTTHCAIIHDLPVANLDLLRLGLVALSQHFGLTPRPAVVVGNAASETASPPAL